ncbi:glutamate receptor ionotropic, kainate 5-like isoform X1 [Scylla paramamosain]|uniref:glutamate receptor ionotropic, kainate 5-like isoform X1 n=1 Tax=Scylla paramamosain TaxID=85552 RepID=UPI0030832BD9
MMSVLGVLAHSLNFSYNLVRPPDGSFGTRLPNGSGTGMVGMVSRQEVDLGLGPFGVTAARSLIIDYTTPVVNDYLRILAGRGRPEVDPWGFLLPLAPLVWVGLVVALVVVMAIVLLLARCLSLHSPALAPYVRVLLQENSWLPALWGWERLVLGGWMLAMLVVTQSYTGNLMSLLAVRYIPQPFQTLRALLDDSATTMIWEYGTASVNKFRVSVCHSNSAIWRLIADSPELCGDTLASSSSMFSSVGCSCLVSRKGIASASACTLRYIGPCAELTEQRLCHRTPATSRQHCPNVCMRYPLGILVSFDNTYTHQ